MEPLAIAAVLHGRYHLALIDVDAQSDTDYSCAVITTYRSRMLEQMMSAKKRNLRGLWLVAASFIVQSCIPVMAFDFAFIDAHKPEYEDYFERVLTLLRPGGLACVDNVLWRGRVVDSAKVDGEDTKAIMAFNRKVLNDERVSISMVPIGDGLTLVRKRS